MKLPLFFRHLLSYISVFVIPVFIVAFFSYSHFTAIVTDNFNQSKEEALTLIGDLLDSKMTDAINISHQLSQNSDLKPDAMNTFNGFYFSAQRLNYPSANSFFYDIFYYVRDGEFLFSANGTYRLPLFFNQMFHYKEWSFEEFNSLINQSREKHIRGTETIERNNQTAQNFLTITMPIPLNSSRPYGTAIFLIEEKKLREMLRSIINYPDGEILVFNEEGNVLMTLSDQSKTASKEVWEHVQSLSDQANMEIKLNDTNYLVTSVHSSYTNWTMTVLTPKAHLIEPVKALQVKSLKVFAIVLVVGFLMIYFMMYLNYNPLRKLISFTEEIWPKRSGKRYSDLDSVYATIKELDSTSHKLTTQVNQSKEAVLQHCFLQLLKGMDEETSHAINRLRDYGYKITDCGCYVTIVDLEERHESDSQYIQNIVTYIDKHTLQDVDAFRVDMTDPHMLVWIVFVRDEAAADWANTLLAIQQQLELDITIGIGKPVNELANISKSYMQAHNAIQHKLLLGINRVILFNDIQVDHHDIDWKPLQHLEVLKSYIREGYADKLMDMAFRVADEIEKSSPNLFIAKTLVIEVFQTIVREMKNADPTYILNHPDVLTLSNYNRMKDLRSMIEGVIHHAAAHLSKLIGPVDPKLQRMIDYIDENFTDPQFSLQQVADQFYCSTKHANMYFKKHTNMSIMDYVHQCRLDKVKDLLTKQDLKIQDIIIAVGYLDSSSFIRKFKRVVGCTPGEYRRIILHSEGNC